MRHSYGTLKESGALSGGCVVCHGPISWQDKRYRSVCSDRCRKQWRREMRPFKWVPPGWAIKRGAWRTGRV